MFRTLLFKLIITILLDLKETRIRYKRFLNMPFSEDDIYGDQEWILKQAYEGFCTIVWFLFIILFSRWLYYFLINNL